jgi:beta-phosphoglucomutase family hydrolase
MPRRAVIFDMDGVLIDSAQAHKESWRILGKDLGVDVTDEMFAAQFGRASRDIIRCLFGHHLSDETVARYDRRKEEAFRNIVRGRMPFMPGARELVRDLHHAGFALAVGSSGPPENVELCIEEMGLAHCFNAVVNGMDVTYGKPHPQTFLLAAERLGLQPDLCLVVEDAPAGIEAATRAGMKSVALTGTHPASAFPKADLVVDALTEIAPAALRDL